MKYQPSLDGLRAIAITAVVFYHAYPNLFVGGWMGVDIFFVLSGYLITTILKREIDETEGLSFKNFYMRRLLRLGPAAASLYVFEIFRAVFNSPHRTEILQATLVSALYFMNWNQAFDLFPQDILGHTWSLSMEEQFYLLWPAALLFINRRRPAIWLSIAITSILFWRCGLVAFGSGGNRLYNGFDTHSDGLLTGCLVAFCANSDWLRGAAKAASLPAILAMCFALFLLPYDAKVTLTIGLTVVAIASAIVMVSSFEDQRMREFLRKPALVFTGKISYGWYLWHFPAIFLAGSHVNKHSPGGALIFAAAIPASYLAAVGSYFLIERPFLRLKRNYPAAAASEASALAPAA
ncbi:acyltransferase family protein [Bradyrhizobium sp.]|uniref:acyltransferase family protein n=1 Tax=Bradyrhizobium sp. TaxID=376 RepID=UPI003C404962